MLICYLPIGYMYNIPLAFFPILLQNFVFLTLLLFMSCYPWSFRMHRQPDHVMAFLLAELGTSGSLDGQQRLVVKGRFAPKNFEGILRRYISKYPLYIELLYMSQWL